MEEGLREKTSKRQDLCNTCSIMIAGFRPKTALDIFDSNRKADDGNSPLIYDLALSKESKNPIFFISM